MRADPRDNGLTPREMEVLRLLAAGWSNSDIARELCITPKTVGNHLTSIFSKLGVQNRNQALLEAIALGLATPGER